VRDDAEPTDAELDAVLASPAGEHVKGMMRVTAAGTADQVHDYLKRLAERTNADELMLSPASPVRGERIRAVEMVAAPERAVHEG
jgi:hypothetical protein